MSEVVSVAARLPDARLDEVSHRCLVKRLDANNSVS